MRLYGMCFFVEKDDPAVPSFDQLGGGPFLRIGPNASSFNSQVDIFFDNVQSATNFKNEVIQSWETFIRKQEKE